MSKEQTLNEKSKENFLTYAGAVIKGRAISNVEDNLKPAHRRILYTFYEEKLTPDKGTRKSATVAGQVLAYHPHGDAAVYDTLIRMAQPWKMRYPFIFVQGNLGNILGDSAAAARYTEVKLTDVGMLMLEDLNRNCVPFTMNYDETKREPLLLPSKFPNILCNGNNGIAIGLSAGLVPHNYNEVADAIKHRIDNPNCTLKDIRTFIKGPDFPTGGIITNGEKLDEIYLTGHGTVNLRAQYRIETVSGRTQIIFTEIPYLVDIEPGIIEKLKKALAEENYTAIDDIENNTNEKNVEIRIILSKYAKVDEVLAFLFAKTGLEETVKINNTVLVKGEPEVLGLMRLIDEYIKHRQNVILNIAKDDLEKVRHKYTVAIGLQKSLADIDLLVSIIRNADGRNIAKAEIIKAFELNDEQAEAILEMKLSRLSRLDVKELVNDIEEFKDDIFHLEETVNDVNKRNYLIKMELDDMRKKCGDKRRTTINCAAPVVKVGTEDYEKLPIQPMFFYADKIDSKFEWTLLTVLKGRSEKDFFVYSEDGNVVIGGGGKLKISGANNILPASFFITVTKNGYIKSTLASEYGLTKIGKALKLKDDDKLLFAGFANESDFVLLLGENGDVAKIAVSELKVSGKLTLGSQLGLGAVKAALIGSDNDFVLLADKTNHGKITSVRDFTVNSRTSSGQTVAEGTIFMIKATDREEFYGIPASGNKAVIIKKDNLAIKSKTAQGASLATKTLVRIV